MPFYALLQDEQDDIWRYLITFPDHETADEWWRLISASPGPYSSNVKRISPQTYSQNKAYFNDVTDFFSNKALPNAKQFGGRISFTPLNKPGGEKIPFTIPLAPVTDHISGKWYFIRSKADSSSYWYLRTKGTCLVCGSVQCEAIHVAREYRTKFCVQVRNLSVGDKALVMIGRDKISIAGPGDFTVHANAVQDLRATKAYQGRALDLVFGDLKDRFVTRAEKRANGEIWEYVELVEKGQGEAWELVS